MRYLRFSRPVAAVLACSVHAPSLAAQIVRGTVLAEGTSEPVSGAVVVLIDSMEVRRAATLSDDAGRFAIRAPAAGRYALRTERIGYASARSSSFDLGAGETVQRRLTASAVAVSLRTVDVRASGRCVVRPRDGEQTFRVWEEARKALSASALTESQGLLRLTTARFERQHAPNSNLVIRERRWKESRLIEQHIASNDPEKLAKYGYVATERDSIVFYAPNAGVLLSDVFANDHCLRLQRDDEHHPRMIGVGFEPSRGRKLPDVKGVLWLDAATAELRSLEYRYTSVPVPALPEPLGGRLDFERLRNGAWIVRRWVIRLPVTVVQDVHELIPGQKSTTGVGIREVGGEVTEMVLLAPRDSTAH